MLATTESVAIVGTEAILVRVEVDVTTGIPGFKVVGQANRSVKEAELRVRGALLSSDQKPPAHRVVANLAPGDLPKDGTHFDLPLALATLVADEKVKPEPLAGWVVMGELSLDGSVRPVRGILAAALACRSEGRLGLICPRPNAAEAAIVDGVKVVPVATLAECIAFLEGDWLPQPAIRSAAPASASKEDMTEVRGHEEAKAALAVAAAGGHNILMSGPPGSGKTMLARRLPSILPPMSLEESFEVTRVHSVAGLLGEDATLLVDRPFRSPHHHVSLAGLIGGGTGLPRPGEVSLAHHGVLFLDELGLYRRSVLESLRAPLEEGKVRISRAAGSMQYPCRFSLVAAMNPCPCGYNGDRRRTCRCSEHQLSCYEARLSGPLLDRFDLRVGMSRPLKTQLLGPPEGEPSAVIRERVEKARLMQAERYGSALTTNASASKKQIEEGIRLSKEARIFLSDSLDHLDLTGRGLDRVLRVARTLADLEGADVIDIENVSRALTLRVDGAIAGGGA